MLLGWYDKEGKLIPGSDSDDYDGVWKEAMGRVEALLRNHDYKRVARDVLPNGMVVSTVWLGRAQYGSTDDKPLIFETMTFPSEDDWAESDMERYSTLAEAQEGHKRMVEKWKSHVNAGGEKEGRLSSEDASQRDVRPLDEGSV